VQATGSLVTYSLLLWDSLLAAPYEDTDDYLFYVKAVTKCLEFLMAAAIVIGGKVTRFCVRHPWSQE
jgi:hypothetical protein